MKNDSTQWPFCCEIESNYKVIIKQNYYMNFCFICVILHTYSFCSNNMRCTNNPEAPDYSLKMNDCFLESQLRHQTNFLTEILDIISIRLLTIATVVFPWFRKKENEKHFEKPLSQYICGAYGQEQPRERSTPRHSSELKNGTTKQ